MSPREVQDLWQDHLGGLWPARRPGQSSRSRRQLVRRPPQVRARRRRLAQPVPRPRLTPVTETDSSAGASPGAGGHWDDVYRTRAVDQVSWHQHTPATSLRLIGPRPGPDSRAVDVGGGTSTLVDVLLRDGWTVTVLDVSAEALGITGRRLGARAAEVSFVVSDVLAWEPEQTYDVWHDRAVLHFLTEAADRARYVELAVDTVSKGGAVVIGGFAPDGPSHCSGLPTVRRSAEQLAGEFAPCFTLEHAETESHHTPGGAVQQFTWVRLRRD